MSVVPFTSGRRTSTTRRPTPSPASCRGHQGVAVLALMRVMAVACLRWGRSCARRGFAGGASLVLGNLAPCQTSLNGCWPTPASATPLPAAGFVAATPGAYAGMLFYLLPTCHEHGRLRILTPSGWWGRDRHRPAEDWAGSGRAWDRGQPVHVLPAGLPPMAGFYGKYMIFKELILQGTWAWRWWGPGQPGVGLLLPAVPVALFRTSPPRTRTGGRGAAAGAGPLQGRRCSSAASWSWPWAHARDVMAAFAGKAARYPRDAALMLC